MDRSVFITKTTKITREGIWFRDAKPGDVWQLPQSCARKLVDDGDARYVDFADTASHTKDLGAAPFKGGVVPGFSEKDPPSTTPPEDHKPKRKRGRPRKNPLL
jgi:hypothetical protein